jgi:Ran GTPase-activating protein (RanGAP) involved in mRNA processing and transport
MKEFTPLHSSPIICPIDDTFQSEPGIAADLMPLLDYLASHDIAEEDITFLKGTVTTDGRLDLCKQSIGPEGARLVAEALGTNTTIRHLLLGTNGIGNEGALSLTPLIEQTTALQTLYLGCNYIQAPGIASLSQALQNNKSIEGLWLKRNPLGREGASAIAHLLKNTQSLRMLDLVNTDLGTDGLKLVLEALLDSSQSVERLYLGGNQITAAEAPWLAELITRNPKIKGLLLNANALGDQGVQILTQALRKNTTLVELGLASNGIEEDGAITLVEAIQQHPSLKVLDLGYSPSTRVLGAKPNHLTDKVAESLAHYITSNAVIHTLNLVRHSFSQSGFGYLRESLEKSTSLQNLILDGNPPQALNEMIKSRKNAATFNIDSAVAAIRSVYR